MKKVIAGALLGYLGLLAAAEAVTNGMLAELNARLNIVVSTLNPKPDIRIDPAPAVTILHAAYLPQTNKVRRVLSKKEGDLSANVENEIGPSPKGFVLYVRCEPKGTPSQLELPQSGCDITPIDRSDQQLFWHLSSGSEADAAMVKAITETIRQMKDWPNQVPEDTARKLADPQHWQKK